jgi:hypothetical protein
MMLFTILAILVIIVLAAVAVLNVLRAQKRRYARSYNLVLQNTGNMRSRYELQSNDPTGMMIFNFVLNGTPLGPPQGARNAAGQSGLSTTKAAVATAGNRMQSARFNAGRVTTTIGGLLSEVGYLLPGAMGQSLRNMSQQVRGVDNQIQRVQLTTGRATRLAGIASDTAESAGRLVPGAGQGKAAEAPADDRTLTPYIEPGAQLQVQLMAAPADTRNARSTSFTVVSRATEAADAEVMMQQGVVDYSTLSNTRYIVLYALIGVAALGALWVVLYGTATWGR